LVRPTNNWRSRRSEFKHILIALDGSEEAEMVLPYIRAFAMKYNSKILLVSVPEGSESEGYGEKVKLYLDSIADSLKIDGLEVNTHYTGSGPARTILAVAEDERIDLIMMASHGRGGANRAHQIPIGSVAEKVVKETLCPVFLLPLHRIGKQMRERTENSDVKPLVAEDAQPPKTDEDE
jgi:nucleotide-binding universal stress UspA family protein